MRVYRFGPPKPFGIYVNDMPLYTVHDFELNAGIYFFETSPVKAIFTIFHYCAFESAALANPHRNVYVIVSEENRNLKRGTLRKRDGKLTVTLCNSYSCTRDK